MQIEPRTFHGQVQTIITAWDELWNGVYLWGFLLGVLKKKKKRHNYSTDIWSIKQIYRLSYIVLPSYNMYNIWKNVKFEQGQTPHYCGKLISGIIFCFHPVKIHCIYKPAATFARYTHILYHILWCLQCHCLLCRA